MCTGLLRNGNGGSYFLVVSFVLSLLMLSLLALSLLMLSLLMLSFDAECFFDFFDFLVAFVSLLDMSELLDASDFIVSDLASVLAGAVEGAGAGVCAAAVRETAKAPAISADINLFMNSSSVSLFES